VKFTILLPPTGQKRARSRGFVKPGGAVCAQTYKDKGQRIEENKLIALMYEHRPPEPLQGPLVLWVKAYLPIPKSMSKAKLREALERRLFPTTKPDVSNLLKQIEDVMNGVFWVDDKQIVIATVEKLYSDPPRWELRIEELG